MELVSGRRLQNRLGLRDSPSFWKDSSIFEAILGLIISYVCELLCQRTQYVQLGFISPFHLFMMKACLFVSKIPWVLGTKSDQRQKTFILFYFQPCWCFMSPRNLVKK